MLAIFVIRFSSRAVYFIQSGSALSVLLYFTLTKISKIYSSLVILTYLLNKQMVFFDKMCQ